VLCDLQTPEPKRCFLTKILMIYLGPTWGKPKVVYIRRGYTKIKVGRHSPNREG